MVDNGTTGATTPATAWTLSAGGPTPITGATGSAPVTQAAVQVGTYTLSESGPAGYAASSWTCSGAASSTIGSVTLAEGQNATCTVTNTAIGPQLTLVKVVANGTSGGTAVPGDWTLTGTGPTTVSGATGTAPVTAANVPIGSYALSESGPSGYSASAWACVGGTPGAGSIALALGQQATCTITNTAIAPRLTLIKTVTNDNGGTAVPRDWTLTATGPGTASGLTGDPAITDAPVTPGRYSLTESGPSGYLGGTWSCTGTGTLTGTSLALQLGQTATCTITNDDQPATLTLVKTVTNDNGGTALPTAWTLSAAGPTTITGATGSDAVTAVPVTAGSYELAESGGPFGYTRRRTGRARAPARVTRSTRSTWPSASPRPAPSTTTTSPAPDAVQGRRSGRSGAERRVPADWTLHRDAGSASPASPSSRAMAIRRRRAASTPSGSRPATTT